MAKKKNIEPRNFYLNERHLFSPDPTKGGGGSPKLDKVNWGEKANNISTSIEKLSGKIEKSADPLKNDRYFAIAVPEEGIKKLTDNKKKSTDGKYLEEIDFSGEHGKVLERLGLDLIEVSDAGHAVVHAKPEQFDQLKSRSLVLGDMGIREQSRWVSINSFDLVPMESRVDADWLGSLAPKEATDVIFELQPVINKLEANSVIQAISTLLNNVSEGLSTIGTDFSGRFWVRGMANRSSINKIAKNFYSIQSIHHPLFSYGLTPDIRRVSNGSRSGRASTNRGPQAQYNPDLPCIAVVDTGIPNDHKCLSEFRRGTFVPQGAVHRDIANHGSVVASRAVFGHCETYDELSSVTGACNFYDAVAADAYEDKVDDKLVLAALAGVRGNAPDVRVFNLSFGSRESLSAMSPTVYRERLLELQDLDNFAFANDSIIVVAAGNSNKGVIPNADYPEHYNDPRWELGAWACGYNTLVCGSHISKLVPDGLASNMGYPSPFSRVGFGLNNAPVPSFSASGGNCNESYQSFNGGGVFCYNRMGDGEDRIGTSLSAPILAREAALAIEELKRYCPTGSQPSAVLIRASLAMFADRVSVNKQLRNLFDRTLGYGETSHKRLTAPNPDSAVVLWQGTLESPRDLVGVRIPIPRKWLAEANSAQLKIFVCHDSPVNSAVVRTWACRKVNVRIRTAVGERAISGTAAAHKNYPLFTRKYNLSQLAEKHQPSNDFWLMELSYEEITPYPAGSSFDPRQKVAVIAQLDDIGKDPVNPQEAMQTMPLATEFNQLSANSIQTRTPVIIRNR